MKKNAIVCSRCGSNDHTKAGKIREKQRYHCENCGYHYTIFNVAKQNWNRNSRRKALILYIEGFSFRFIGRLLEVSHITIKNWIVQSGVTEEFRNNTSPEILECEMPEIARTIQEKCISAETWLLVGVTKNYLGTYCLQSKKE